MLCYLCYFVLFCVKLCCVMLCCVVILCYVVLCYVMLCCVMLCYVMFCYVMLCCVVLCCVVLYYVMYATLFSPIRATFPSHLILLDLFTLLIFSEQYRSVSSSLCSFLHSPVTSSLLGPNVLLNTLFTNILSLYSFPKVRDQVSNPLLLL